MARSFRSNLIRVVTFLGGIYFFLEYFLPKNFGFDSYHQQISNGFVTIGAMAIGLGLINLGAVHGSRIVFRRKNWGYSSVLLAGLFVMMFVTVGDWLAVLRASSGAEHFSMVRDFAERIEVDLKEKTPNVPALTVRIDALVRATEEGIVAARAAVEKVAPSESEELSGQLSSLANLTTQLQAASNAETLDLTPLKATLAGASATYRTVALAAYERSAIKFAYTVLYDGLFIALGSAMFALLGFYIAGAAFRAFRIRSAESGLMMLAAVIVMLGQIPFGLWLWSGLPELRLWLLTVPSTAAFRAIKIGAAVAGLILAIRMWWSIEPSPEGEAK